MVDFSFIIVTFNSDQLIKDAIDSIVQYEYESLSSFEIIIVDHSSHEKHQVLLKVLQEHCYYSRLNIVHNPDNPGYGAGNNAGIKLAAGKFIAIFNPDVRLTEPLLDIVWDIYRKNSDLGLLGFKQIGGENLSFYRKPEWNFFLSGWYMKIMNKLSVFNYRKDFLSGAFFFLDRDKFMNSDLFDENIFMYNEEADISNRLLKNNILITFNANHSYLHLINNRPFSSDAYLNEMKSLKYYLKKFSINKEYIVKLYLKELKFKIFIARLFKKHEAENRFKTMIAHIKTVFNS